MKNQMADDTPNATRGYLPIQFIDAILIDDPAEQERLNRTLRRPDGNRKSGKAEPNGATSRMKKTKRSNHRTKRKKKR